MDDVVEPGPGSKPPTRTNARPATPTRTPAARKPPAKRPTAARPNASAAPESPTRSAVEGAQLAADGPEAAATSLAEAADQPDARATVPTRPPRARPAAKKKAVVEVLEAEAPALEQPAPEHPVLEDPVLEEPVQVFDEEADASPEQAAGTTVIRNPTTEKIVSTGLARLRELAADFAASVKTVVRPAEPFETIGPSAAMPGVLPDTVVEPQPEVSPEDVAAPEVVAEPEVLPAPEVVAEPEVLPAPEVVPKPVPEPVTTAVARSEAVERVVVAPIDLRAPQSDEVLLSVRGLTKRFDEKVAVDGIDLTVETGNFYGFVGPNGAGKTTTLSMITGLLRPDAGTVTVYGSNVWAAPEVAKRQMGVLPDRLRLFDRLTGGQLLYYSGVLRGLESSVVKSRSADLASAFGLEDSLGRLVSDYSAGMTKKIALAMALIHSPRLLVLDEPFESVDPVSAATVTDILKKYVAAGGTVLLSSHSMDLVQRICDRVAVVINGRILADGTMAEVREGGSLEDRFVALAGGRRTVEGLEWLHSFSD